MSKSNRFLSGSSRFSILNDPVEPKPNNSQKEPRSNALFNNRSNNNSRFESLKDEPVPLNIDISVSDINYSDRNYSDRNYSDRNYSDRSISNSAIVRNNSFKATTPVKKTETVVQQTILKETDFPDLLSVSTIKKEEPANKWTAIVKKEVVIEVKESEKDKLPYVAPGWICIRKNPKTGKSETIQGPLTEEQKQYERQCYLEQYDFKYNMLKTIERMSARWDEYKEQYDERYGHGVYNEKYGISSSDYDDDDDDDDDESDSDSEYEYVYE